MLDGPKKAVPVGVVAGDQLLSVSKSPDPGLRSQVASCACASRTQAQAATSHSNTPSRSARDMKLRQTRQSVWKPFAALVVMESRLTVTCPNRLTAGLRLSPAPPGGCAIVF